MFVVIYLWVLLMGTATGVAAFAIALTKYRSRGFAAICSGMAVFFGLVGVLILCLNMDILGFAKLAVLDLLFGSIGLYGWFKTRARN